MASCRPNSLSFRGNEVTVGISRKRNRSFRRLTGGRGTPLHYLTARNGCHAITPLLPICRPIHALRGPGHSRKVASRHGQAFNSVLYQTLVISLTPILDRGESPHRWLFCYFFLHLKKVEHYSFVSFLKKRLFYLPQSKAVAAANFISALSCRCRNSNPPCRRPRTPSRWAGARGKRGSRWL